MTVSKMFSGYVQQGSISLLGVFALDKRSKTGAESFLSVFAPATVS